MALPDSAYARLLALRTGLRHFERWSARQARAAGLTPAQHQLLLAIRGHSGAEAPTIGEAADYLLLRHHSTVELVDRAEAAGLVRRTRSGDDHRIVRLSLTDEGAARLEALSALHLEELRRLALDLPQAWQGLAPVQRPHGFAGEPRERTAHGERSEEGRRGGGGERGERGGDREPSGARSASVDVGLVRVYDAPEQGPTRVLVDRLWPRGVAKARAPFDEWMKDVAPTPELRKWYGHRPERFKEFSRRYREELRHDPARGALERLRASARSSPVVLVTATKDLEHSGAIVLKDVLSGR